ncbi:glutathione reductase (NADPH) [Nematocida sp. AWRm78]|nr:glutathione reductase (NADPH) [Nematocida sp. AWRm79]KAI5186073.1 glutathione reductase (NADPH) [Nematocida sp. AWRm78]
MYDLAVIGGGSGGLAISRRSAYTYGKSVLLIEKDVLGGTCVNNGCIPKKMLYNLAFLHSEIVHLYGKSCINLAWDEFNQKRTKYIKFLNEMYKKRNENDKITTVTGSAIIKNGVIEVNGEEYTASKTVLSMGSYPDILDCEGKEHLLTSDDFFRFTAVPDSVIIIGTGYIAIETAFVLQECNCKVTLIARGDSVLRSFDTMIQTQVKNTLLSKGIKILEKTAVLKIEKISTGIKLSINKEGVHDTITASKVICAIGRLPNTESIHNDNIKFSDSGFIITDKSFCTTDKDTFAIGDITTSDYMLTPVAIFSGRRLSDYLYSNTTGNIKGLIKSVPTVIFSHPPAGSVGLSENDCMSINNRKVQCEYSGYIGLSPDECISDSVCIKEISLFHYNSIFTAYKNVYKFVYGSVTGLLYGVHVYGYECDEVLQGYSVLVRNQVTYTQMVEYFDLIGGSSYEILSGIFE